MKLRKILSLVLALVMLLSVLAACNTEKPVETQPKETQGNTPVETTPTETTEPKVVYTFPLAEPLTITVDALLAKSAYPLADNIAWQYMQELSGFQFETTEIISTEFSEKMNLLMNSGEYAEMIFKGNSIDINQYGMDGLILPIEDIIKEYMPNLCAILDERNAWDTITAPDGHIYSIPNVQASSPMYDSGMTVWINKPWLDKLGLEEPKSYEELYTVLKAFKEQDPNGNGVADEIPLAVYNQGALHFLTTVFDYGLSYGGHWMVVDGEMQYLPTHEVGKEALTWLTKFYAEGLINEDCFTSDREKYVATAANSADVIYGMAYCSALSGIIPDEERVNWVTVKPANPENHALSSGVRSGALALTDKCQNPEVILAWFDYLYTEEGGRIIRSGVEGVSYKINEDGTFESIKDGFESVTYQASLMGAANVPGRIPDLYYYHAASAVTRWNNYEWYGEDYGIGTVGVYVPSLILTTEETEEYSVLKTDISTTVDSYYAEVISGMKDLESTWEDFQKSLKTMGVERMVEIYSDAYQRAVENQNASAGN